jgi:hypothetical protein
LRFSPSTFVGQALSPAYLVVVSECCVGEEKAVTQKWKLYLSYFV